MTIETTYNNLAFIPGDTLSGRVNWAADNLGTSSEMTLRLFYFTEGNGRRDQKTVAEKSFPSGAGGGEFDFEFPEGSPFSHRGKLFSIKWALEFRSAKGAKRSDRRERLELVYSPSGAEIDLYAHATEGMPVVTTGIRVGPG